MLQNKLYYKIKTESRFVTKFSNVKNRPNKIAKGMTKNYERACFYGKTDCTMEVNTLLVRGTLDPLAKRAGIVSISKKIIKEHPADKGYAKSVYVLSEAGRTRLKSLKSRI